MTSNIENASHFLLLEAKEKLKDLTPSTQPSWGIMTPQHMLEHLIVTYKLSIGRIKISVISKEEDRERLKEYLMKDSPMRRNVTLPTGKGKLQPLRFAGLDEAKEKFIIETESFLKFTAEQPEFMFDHPYGGPMTAQEWLLFHRKHVKHHFIQFGLIPDYE
ncbi:MAG: oxepin-CoA hydrolase/3-oxo-5,6-dehydrosuberyl-CoA semialdehyde dehydrogenase [Roseivirga sp.]|jgi:oxepin-CoA hydrolase/3-oxo-5,6-dehydrosuberyl-CoA semialdehyde dehydrogenase